MSSDTEEFPSDSSHSMNDEIDIFEIISILWKKRVFIILVALASATISSIASLMMTNYYTSESILISADSNASSNLSEFSGLASLAGIGLPNAGGDPIEEMIAVIKSRKFIRHLITFEGVTQKIMAPKSYDPLTKTLQYDESIYSSESNEWNTERGIKPNYLEVHEKYLSQLLSISQNTQNGHLNIKIEHISPIFAKELLELIIREANFVKRQRDLDISIKAVKFLEQELKNTQISSIKESINDLLKIQLESQMMSKINEEYSLVIIEPPFVPDKRSKPARSLIVILSSFFSVMTSLVYVLITHYFPRREKYVT